MASFRLNNGTGGCPPTATPPGDYTIPFRFDDAGRLWLSEDFKGFRYFGAARHEISVMTDPLGTANAAVSNEAQIISGDTLTAGSSVNLNVYNDSESTLGVLLSVDVHADIVSKTVNMIRVGASSRWQGSLHSLVSCSTANHDGIESFIRQEISTSSSPHDLEFDVNGNHSQYVNPGNTAVVSCKLFITYAVGAPAGTEYIYTASGVVRAYGYVIS